MTRFSGGPRRLYVETTTRCNLKCAMCMKLARHTDIPEADMGMEVFRALVPVMGGLERMMLNGVGEPLLNPHLPEMVRLARRHMPAEASIGFQSNGLLLTQELADELLRAGLDRVCLSVDTVRDSDCDAASVPALAGHYAPENLPECGKACVDAPAAEGLADELSKWAANPKLGSGGIRDSAVAEHIGDARHGGASGPASGPLKASAVPGRDAPVPLSALSGRELHCGGKASRLERAFGMLRRAAQKAGRQDFRLGVEFVLMRDNCAELPEVVEWAARQGASFALVSHVFSYHPATAEQDLFNPNTGRAVELFARCKAEAARRGLNLKDYSRVLWKWHKTEADAELVAFVDAFIAHAQAQGVMVHFPRLLEWDEKDLPPVEQAFARARAIADEAGLELDLPPLKALDERHCSFVENGTMFVTPEGDVRPCYFLWHRYSCFMDAMSKRVEPLTFGNVLETDAAEVWNSGAYAGFRDKVLAYDYPFCTNCAFTPCPDLLGENGPFEEDCYGVDVPCGHCVWCMGGVRCMD